MGKKKEKREQQKNYFLLVGAGICSIIALVLAYLAGRNLLKKQKEETEEEKNEPSEPEKQEP